MAVILIVTGLIAGMVPAWRISEQCDRIAFA